MLWYIAILHDPLTLRREQNIDTAIVMFPASDGYVCHAASRELPSVRIRKTTLTRADRDAHKLQCQRHDDPPGRRTGGGLHADPGIPAEPERGIAGRKPVLDGASRPRSGRH